MACCSIDFIVTDQAGEDGQARRVGRSPARRTRGIRVQVKDRAGTGLPAAAGGERGVQLIQFPVVTVNHQHVPVALSIQPALDGRVGRDGVGAGVAFVGIVKRHGDAGRVPGDDHIGDAEWPPVVAGPEVRVQGAIAPDAVDERVRVRVHRQLVDRRVPSVVGRKWTLPMQVGIDAEIGRLRCRRHPTASSKPTIPGVTIDTRIEPPPQRVAGRSQIISDVRAR